MKNFPIKHVGLRPRVILAASLALALTACAGLPSKVAPPTLQDEVPLAGLQTPTRAGWPDSQWWRQYDDPQLDQLMNHAMQESPDLALAQSRVQGAEESANLAAAQLGLSANGSAQFTRQRLSDTGLIPPKFLGFNWYNQADIGVQLQYDFDWWGKKRSTMEAALDQAHAAEAQRSAAALAIQYAIADTYFGWQADQARLQIAEQLLANQQQLESIAALRVKQGVDLPDEAEKAMAQLAAAREMWAAIAGSARIRYAALASLLGMAPAQMPELEPRPLPAVEHGLPTNVGLDLIARRPDIAASRWQVEAALKKTDAARAEFFPDISLQATAGLSSLEVGELFTPGSRTFALTPAIHLPIFNKGSIKANYGVSKAQLEEAVAQYDSTIQTAAREVSTQALTSEQIAARQREQKAQLDADQKLLNNAQARARQGVRDARERLAARANLLQQQDASAQLKAQALSTDLSLIKALGGGYRDVAQTTASSQSPTPSPNTGAADHERH